MNATVRVGQRLCEHAGFPHRNCLVVSRPFYTAFLPSECEDALGRRVDLSACFDPSLGTVGEHVRLYTVGVSGVWISTVQRTPYNATLPYPNAPPLDLSVHVLALSEGHSIRIEPDCEVYMTPLTKYRVEIVVANDTAERGAATRSNATHPSTSVDGAAAYRNVSSTLVDDVAVSHVAVWAGSGGAIILMLAVLGRAWVRRRRKVPR